MTSTFQLYIGAYAFAKPTVTQTTWQEKFINTDVIGAKVAQGL